MGSRKLDITATRYVSCLFLDQRVIPTGIMYSTPVATPTGVSASMTIITTNETRHEARTSLVLPLFPQSYFAAHRFSLVVTRTFLRQPSLPGGLDILFNQSMLFDPSIEISYRNRAIDQRMLVASGNRLMYFGTSKKYLRPYMSYVDPSGTYEQSDRPVFSLTDNPMISHLTLPFFSLLS